MAAGKFTGHLPVTFCTTLWNSGINGVRTKQRPLFAIYVNQFLVERKKWSEVWGF